MQRVLHLIKIISH